MLSSGQHKQKGKEGKLMSREIHLRLYFEKVDECPRCGFPIRWYFEGVSETGNDVAFDPDFLKNFLLESMYTLWAQLLTTKDLPRVQDIVLGLVGKNPIEICPITESRVKARVTVACPLCTRQPILLTAHTSAEVMAQLNGLRNAG